MSKKKNFLELCNNLIPHGYIGNLAIFIDIYNFTVCCNEIKESMKLNDKKRKEKKIKDIAYTSRKGEIVTTSTSSPSSWNV
jgi:hypothetical protein